MVLAFTKTVSAAFGDSRLKGIVSLFIGLTLGLVGIDLQDGSRASRSEFQTFSTASK